MSNEIDPRDMSQAELEEYLDKLTRERKDDTPEFHRAYKAWEQI